MTAQTIDRHVNRLLHMLGAIGTVIAVTFATAVIGSWAADRSPAGRVIANEVLTPTVAPGGLLRMRLTVERDRACETHVDPMLVDAANQRKLLEDVDVAAPLGPKEYVVPVDVPTYFVPGPARYITATSYVCNPIHKWFPVQTGVRETVFEVRPHGGP